MKTYRKTAHPSVRGGYQGWEETQVCDTLNIFDITELRTAILVVDDDDKNDNPIAPTVIEAERKDDGTTAD